MRLRIGNSHFGGHHATPRYLVDLAHKLRANPTTAEAKLWEHLRLKRLSGMRFRFQHIIQRYIVDFFCYEHRLIVEVDGNVHENQIDYDKLREEQLFAQRYTIIRFTNDEVLNNTDKVLQRILQIRNHPFPQRGRGRESTPLVPAEGARGREHATRSPSGGEGERARH